jgi:hypothetical protein
MEREATAHEVSVHLRIAEVDAALNALKADREALVGPVREDMEQSGVSAIVHHGKALFRLDSVERGTLDRKAVEAAHPGLLDRFTTVTTGFRFTVGRVARAARMAA